MVRIAGIELENKKRVEYALTGIFGIGLTTSRQILTKNNINFDIRIKDLSDEEISLIRQSIEKEFEIEGDLKRRIDLTMKRLSDINCYRGQRHRNKLPARGQRTKTNARTRRGRPKTVEGKKK